MPYKTLSLCIFLLLILLIALMMLFPTPFVIGLGTILTPILIALQAFVILRAGEQSRHSFKDRWYDKS